MELELDLPAKASSSDEPTLSPSAIAAAHMATPSAATAAENTSTAAAAQSQAPASLSGLQPPLAHWTPAAGPSSTPWTSTAQRPDTGGELSQASISVLIRNTFAAAQAAAVAAASPGRRPEWAQTPSLGYAAPFPNFQFQSTPPNPSTHSTNQPQPRHYPGLGDPVTNQDLMHALQLDQHASMLAQRAVPDMGLNMQQSHGLASAPVTGMGAMHRGPSYGGLGSRTASNASTLFNSQAAADSHMLPEGLNQYGPLSPPQTSSDPRHQARFSNTMIQLSQPMRQQQLTAESIDDLMASCPAEEHGHISSASSPPAAPNVSAQAGGGDVGRPKTNRCLICKKEYARPSTLKTHMRTHTQEKPYQCSDCPRRFSQAANLNAHKRTHTGDKPFTCDVCGRSFSQSSSVTTHKRTHTGVKPYQCTACPKKFADTSTLTKHTRIHTGIKPYTCGQCNQAFTQSGNLNRHMKTHSKKAIT